MKHETSWKIIAENGYFQEIVVYKLFRHHYNNY